MPEKNERLNGGQAEPIQLELSRHLLKKVAKVLKRHDDEASSEWLKADFIRPSIYFGRPITVTSDTDDYARIQQLWLRAVDLDVAVKEEGALVLNVMKNGAAASHIDVGKLHIHPEAMQANVLRQHVAPPAPVPAPSKNALPNSDQIDSPSSVSLIAGGVKVSGPSPTAISPTSSLRSSASSDAPGHMRLASRYVIPHDVRQGHVDKPATTNGSSYVTRENDSLRSTPETQGYALGVHNRPKETTTQGTASLRVTPEPSAPGPFRLNRRLSHRSASTTHPSSLTTVVFEAKITTGDNTTEIPFEVDNMHEAVDDIMAYVNWKNSDQGRNDPVGFETYMSIIMPYRRASSNALVLHKESKH